MKRHIATVLFLIIVLTGSIAFAEGAKTDCVCVKGGSVFPSVNFLLVSVTERSALGCDTNIGLGIGLGADNGRVQVGFGYNQGLIGLGLGAWSERTVDNNIVWFFNRL
jgi:hypothetical protein